MRTILSFVLITTILTHTASARRLKAYSYPKQIAAGQMAMIVMENPNFDKVFSRTNCEAEKLIGWVKDEVPILRIEQNGKSIFTSLGSFQTMGDSAIASWMIPVTLLPGQATIYIINDHDASIPYPFTVIPKMNCNLIKTLGDLKPLQKFSVVGEGFVGMQLLDTKVPIHALEMNIGYSKLPVADQYTALNKRMAIDWAQIPTADFLAVDQGAKHWDIFVEGCGITKDGLTLDFICPPDLTPGVATITLSERYNNTEACKSAPLQVTVQ
ncbi:MAG TPA: hypothetical protein VEW28_07810 [Candidatus Kapabacteria bacterium]|nr:hypothetical protein [Candidatus Kapabacteria bacterium]